MIVRGRYDWKPTDPKLIIQHPLDWPDPKADIVWMDYDECYKDPIMVGEDAENVPEEIKAFIPKWREGAKEALKRIDSFLCPIKYASSDVYYKGEKYRVGTGIISDISDYTTIGWLFECIEKEIARDMYSIGAIYVEYNGMMD